MAEPRSFFSLSEAAKQTGKSKSVISNAIKKGRMSASKNELGHYSIDPAELFRVYPQNGENAQKNQSKERNSTPEKNGENAHKIKALEAEVNFLTKEKSSLEKQLEKSEQSEQDWKEQAQTLLLTHKPEAPPAAQGKPEKKGGALKAVAWGVGGFLLIALAALVYLLLIERGVL